MKKQTSKRQATTKDAESTETRECTEEEFREYCRGLMRCALPTLEEALASGRLAGGPLNKSFRAELEQIVRLVRADIAQRN